MVKLLQKQIEQLGGGNLGKEALHRFYGIVDKLFYVMVYKERILEGL